MSTTVPVDPVSAIDVPVSVPPRPVGPGSPGGLPAGAGTAPPDTCGDLSFEGFDELRVAVTAMMTRVRAATAGGSSLADLEEAVHQELLTLGAAAVQDGLNAISVTEVRRRDVTGPEGALRPWADPGRTRTVVTLFGDVTGGLAGWREPWRAFRTVVPLSLDGWCRAAVLRPGLHDARGASVRWRPDEVMTQFASAQAASRRPGRIAERERQLQTTRHLAAASTMRRNRSPWAPCQ
jgi:hypothetical protein